jgi:hypothetical protein
MSANRPAKLSMNNPPASLEKVPVEVRGRLEDMRRVGAMLSSFVGAEQRARDRKRLLTEALNAADRHLRRYTFGTSPGDDIGASITEFLNELQDLWRQDLERGLPGQDVEVPANARYSVTKLDADRLSYESQIALFHAATELIPDAQKTAVHALDLVHCFRRLRNVIIHCKPLPDHSVKPAELVTEGDPAEQIRFVLGPQPFLTVDVEDMLRTKGPKDRDLFEWFRQICDTHPAFLVVDAAVQEIAKFSW